MNKTHFEVVEDADIRLTEAMLHQDACTLRSLLHPEVVYTNPYGETFSGYRKLPINDPESYTIFNIEILERTISFFNNVAVVNVVEKRTGVNLGFAFDNLYSTTRVWKFNRNWQMIAATSVII